MSRCLFFLTLLFILLTHVVFGADRPEAVLVKKMISACENVKSARFTMLQTERLPSGKFSISEVLAKVQYNPKKVYLYMVKPNAGAEALWINDRPDAKVLISPGGFPYVNIRFNTHSSLLREDGHHTIEEIGFEQIAAMIRYYSGKMGDGFYKYLSIDDTLTWDNHTCIQITYDYKEYALTNYTVQKGETITSIAAKYFLNDYAVLMANPSVKNYESVKAGQIIKLPNFYCRRLTFLIDKTSFLPIKQTIFDTKGFFEQYEIKSLILNPAFVPDEFSEGYKDYKF